MASKLTAEDLLAIALGAKQAHDAIVGTPQPLPKGSAKDEPS